MWIDIFFLSFLGLYNLASAKLASHDFVKKDENLVPALLRGIMAKKGREQDPMNRFSNDEVLLSESMSTGLSFQQNIEQRISEIEIYEDEMKQIYNQLLQIDTADFPELQSAIDFTLVNVKNGLNEFPKLAKLLNAVIMEISTHNPHSSQSIDIDTQDTTALVQTRRLANEQPDDFNEDNEQYDESSSRKKSQSKHNYKRHFESMPHRYHSIFEIQDAIVNGDHALVSRKLSAMLKKMPRGAQYYATHGRRTEFKDSGNQKYDQCNLLVECVDDMSLYDLFVFFYSDDIDREDGTINNVLENENILKKRVDIIKAAKDAKEFLDVDKIPEFSDTADSNDLDACDNLLKQFYRNIENGDFVIWEGGMVNQVCLAQGTTTYVKPSEMAKVDGGEIAISSFRELIHCAEELFDGSDRKDDPRYKDETFVFGPENKRKIPYDVNLDARDEYGHYSNNAMDPFKTKSFKDVIKGLTGFSLVPGVDDFIEVWKGPEKKEKCRKAVADFYQNIIESEGEVAKLPIVYLVTTHTNGDFGTELYSAYFDLGVYPNKDSNPWPECTLQIEDKAGGLDLATESKCFTENEGASLCPYTAPDLDAEKNPVYKELEEAAKYVFGDNPSTGFVCSVKTAVVDHGKALPGSCCLDAPYQANPWGEKFSCYELDVFGNIQEDETGARLPNQCKNPGPYFGGMSSEVCARYGGTWCPNPTNCTVLQSCIDEYLTCAKAENRTAYSLYLETAPKITEVSSHAQCGTAREYFGFDEDFINDEIICEDIKQFRYSRDFDFIEDFFNQGDDAECAEEYCAPVLVKPKQMDQFPSEVITSFLWRSKNFALEEIASSLDFAVDMLDRNECPSEFIFNAACVTAKTVAMNLLGTAAFAANRVSALSKQIYSEVAQQGDVENREIYENVNVIYENMEITLGYLEQRFNDAFSKLNEITDSTTPDRPTLPPTSTELAPRAGCNRRDDDGDGVTDNCQEDKHAPDLILSSASLPIIRDFTDSMDDKVVRLDKYFTSTAISQRYLNRTVRVTDDCAHPKNLTKRITLIGGSCSQTQFKVVPIDTTCVDHDEKYTTGSEAIFEMYVDENPPEVSCGFLNENTEGEANMIYGNTLLIPHNSRSLVNTGFFVDIDENCPDVVNVDIKVKSNQVSDEKMAFLARTDETINSVEDAFVYVAPASCEEQHDDNVICIKDPKTDLRFYDIEVTATDLVGNVGKDVCRVIVTPKVPDNNRNGKKGYKPPPTPVELLEQISGSTQRFSAGSLTLLWNNVLAPSQMPSAAPSVSSQPTVSAMPSQGATIRSKAKKGGGDRDSY